MIDLVLACSVVKYYLPFSLNLIKTEKKLENYRESPIYTSLRYTDEVSSIRIKVSVIHNKSRVRVRTA